MKRVALQRRITALEYALQYTPGSDDNHSHSVLLELLEELKNETPAAGTAGESCN